MIWEFTAIMKSILHGLTMKSTYPNVMVVILTAVNINTVNMTKKIDYFFSNFEVILFYIFLLFELADLIQKLLFFIN